MTVPHIPSKPANKGAATSGSQRDRRFTDTFFDTYRHPRFPAGRPFTGEREYRSGTSEPSENAGFISSDLMCGEYFCESRDLGQTPEERLASLASAWVAPWLPSGGKKYMAFNYARKRITFDYVRGETDERRELEKYYRAAAKLAGANGWGEIKPGVTPSYQITSVLGEPSPLLPIWQACRAGDPWVMGAVDEPNERLAKILGLGEVQYFGTHFGDAEYVAVAPTAKPEPVMTPDQVLSVPLDQVAKMVEELVAKREADRKAEHAAKSAAGKQAAAKKKAAA